MKITQKLLSVFLAMLMIFSVFSLGFTAFAEDKTIRRIDIFALLNYEGKTCRDYKELIDIKTEHITYDDNSKGHSCLEAEIECPDGSFEKYNGEFQVNETYRITCYLVADKGYVIDKNAEIYNSIIKFDKNEYEIYINQDTGLYTVKIVYDITLSGSGESGGQSFFEMVRDYFKSFFAKIGFFFEMIFKGIANIFK